MQQFKLTIYTFFCFTLIFTLASCGAKKGNESDVNMSLMRDTTQKNNTDTTAGSDTTQTTPTTNNDTTGVKNDTLATDTTNTPNTNNRKMLTSREVDDMLAKVDDISFSSDKMKALMKIVRKDLDEKAQMVFIDYVLGNLDFGDDKITLLKRVIQKDNFTPKVKKHLLANLDDLKFASERERILKIFAQ